MEAQVVVEERVGIVQGRVHARDLVGERGDLLGRGPLRRERGRPRLQDPADLPQPSEVEPVHRGDQAQRLADERGRSVGDEGARALARLDDPHRGEGAESGADAGAADAHLSSQLALGGEAVARPQRPALDQAAHVRDDLLRGDGVAGFGALGGDIGAHGQEMVYHRQIKPVKEAHHDWNDHERAEAPWCLPIPWARSGRDACGVKTLSLF